VLGSFRERKGVGKCCYFVFGVDDSGLADLSSSRDTNLLFLQRFCFHKVVALPFWFFVASLFLPEFFAEEYYGFLCIGESFPFVVELAGRRFVAP